mmetsp:Transcript_69057/g.121947  ORF Transcript_69057/g.121947 Transcript_69057/m.121947 type:complete len:214 (-) Transcript_69057:546-1187(-)
MESHCAIPYCHVDAIAHSNKDPHPEPHRQCQPYPNCAVPQPHAHWDNCDSQSPVALLHRHQACHRWWHSDSLCVLGTNPHWHPHGPHTVQYCYLLLRHGLSQSELVPCILEPLANCLLYTHLQSGWDSYQQPLLTNTNRHQDPQLHPNHHKDPSPDFDLHNHQILDKDVHPKQGHPHGHPNQVPHSLDPDVHPDCHLHTDTTVCLWITHRQRH